MGLFEVESQIRELKKEIKALNIRLDEAVSSMKKLADELEECVRQRELTYQLQKFRQDFE